MMTCGTGCTRPTLTRAVIAAAVAVMLGTGAWTVPARAAGEALLLIEADSGRVLKAENATYPWYPASVTKLMTAYVTLRAVKEGRITLETVLTVSPNAVAQQPTKMGFRSGTLVTVDNALKMLMVKSANDMAVVLAEGVSGSVERFADEMNRTSARLGMVQSVWVNPNGLPADDQITSARDMAILARQVLAEFPEYDGYWNIQAIRLGKRVMRNTNSLLIRYPGTDGMKTGFICASGFNVVASATRGNRRLIAVVLGARSSAVRAAKAAYMFETAFNNTGLNWLMPSFGRVENLQPINAAPPNLREDMCGKQRRRPAAESADDEEDAGIGNGEPGSVVSLFANGRAPGVKPSSLVSEATISGPPVEVYIGPPRRPRDTAVAARPGTDSLEAPAIAAKRIKRKAAGNGLLALPARSGAETAPAAATRPVTPKPKTTAIGSQPRAAADPTRQKPTTAAVGSQPRTAADPAKPKPKKTAVPAKPKHAAAPAKPSSAATTPASTATTPKPATQ